MNPAFSKLMIIVGALLLAGIVVITRKAWSGAFSHGLPSVWRIAKMTVAEARRKRVLQAVLILVVIVLSSLMVFRNLNPSEQARMVKDSGLTTIAVFGMLLSIFIAAFMIPHEIESRTVYPIFAKPVRRYEFLLGKYLGVLIILGLMVAIMVVVLVGVLVLQDHLVIDQPDSVFQPSIPAVVFAAVMSYLSLAVFTALVMLISSVASTAMTIIGAILLWVVGSMQTMFYELSTKVTGAAQVFVKAFYYAVPPLENFDYRNNVANLIPINLSAAVDAVEKGLLYTVVALVFAAVFFENREV